MQEDETCPRCKGSGFDPEPPHIDDLACEDCQGLGIILTDIYFERDTRRDNHIKIP